MSTSKSARNTSRRYTPEEKAQAVRLVRELREERGSAHGAVKRIADQLGYGVESVRAWVKADEVACGEVPGVSAELTAEVTELRQENRELRRANTILRQASAFFAAELDRPRR